MLKKGLFLLATFIGLSCMWDNDTLQMEMKQYPGTIDLITGNFLRHSPEFHYWRIQDRTKKLKEEPMNLAYFDDMAVSHSKLGADSVAIQLMLTSLAVDSSRYETHANLGTFYIHNKQLEKGKEYIEKAIAINPDAHFGREIIQLKLVEYILEQRAKGITGLPLSNEMPKGGLKELGNEEAVNNFYTFIIEEGIKVKDAYDGVEGMMRFGNYNSPILLEALADLLIGPNSSMGSEPLHLVHIALNQAAAHSDNPKLYENKIELALLTMPTSRRFRKKGLDTFAEELKKAEVNFKKLRANEITWILNGKDPEEEYKRYYDNDSIDRLSYEESGSQIYQGLPKDSINQGFKKQLEILMNQVIIQTDTTTVVEHNGALTESVKEDKSNLFWYVLFGALVGGISVYMLNKRKKA